MVPGGIRMGTPALTTRGFVETDFEMVAEFFHRAVGIAAEIQKKAPGNKMKDFRTALESQEWPEISELKADVEDFAMQFPTVGFEKATMKYNN